MTMRRLLYGIQQHGCAIILALGPLSACIASYVAYHSGMGSKIAFTVGLCIWMSLWWMTEVVNLGITALLPIVYLPLFGVADASLISSAYFADSIVVCWGSMLMAGAIEKYRLHKRFANYFVNKYAGAGSAVLLLGFIILTGFSSMWMSNTATAALMCPLARALLSDLHELDEQKDHSQRERVGESQNGHHRRNGGSSHPAAVAIDLGIAYAASIGGMATLTGTGSNLVLEGTVSEVFGEENELSFLTWFLIGAPLSIVNLFILWIILYLRFLHPWTSHSRASPATDPYTLSAMHVTVRRDDMYVDPFDGYGCDADMVETKNPEESRRRNANEDGNPFTGIHAHALGADEVSSNRNEARWTRDAIGYADTGDSQSTMGSAELTVLMTFAAMAMLWMTRNPPGGWGWSTLFPAPECISDGTVAMACCLVLFVLPRDMVRLERVFSAAVQSARQTCAWDVQRPGAHRGHVELSTNSSSHTDTELSEAEDPSAVHDKDADGKEDNDHDGSDEDDRSKHHTHTHTHTHTHDLPTKTVVYEGILGWDAVQSTNWSVLFLLGGGFALSRGFQVNFALKYARIYCMLYNILYTEWHTYIHTYN